MTEFAEAENLRSSLQRLESKVDKIDSKVDTGDRQSQQLVELLKQQLTYLQSSIDEIKMLLGQERNHTDRATSAVRVDLERQLNDHRAQNDKDLTEVIRRMDQGRDERLRMFERLEATEKFAAGQASTNKIMAALGGGAVAGLVGLGVKVIGG